MKYFKNYNDLIFKKLNSVDGNELLRISRIFLKVKKTNNKLILLEMEEAPQYLAIDLLILQKFVKLDQ